MNVTGNLPAPVLLYGGLMMVLADHGVPETTQSLPAFGDSSVAVQIVFILGVSAWMVKVIMEIAHKWFHKRNGKSERTTDQRIVELLEAQNKSLKEIAKHTEDLHEWFDVEVEPGVKFPVWLRQTLAEVRNKLGELVRVSGSFPVRPVDED